MPWMRDREPAEPILFARGDEVGEAHVGPPGALLDLLAKEGESRAVVVEHDDVVALALDRPQADGGARGEPFFVDDRSSIACASANRPRALSPTISSSRIAG